MQKSQITVAMPKELVELVKAIAKKEKRTIANTTRMLVAEALEVRGNQSDK